MDTGRHIQGCVYMLRCTKRTFEEEYRHRTRKYGRPPIIDMFLVPYGASHAEVEGCEESTWEIICETQRLTVSG
ncbi:hypothetical protein BJ508DRAFT_419823 [Ascobolus immersus RN42]|uniref:Uncharacterized protein n=1 Tax=Ascobolus immersus RN42 TaxID=1160509 RepID=A0A3N4HI62_ASCIM|nr:hypothetical protein BJ508DRAFT_419823 [Ascobolus immersus RN42]